VLGRESLEFSVKLTRNLKIEWGEGACV